ncbi:MAG: DNA polymerase III subunit gamma/tau, partial [Ruminococcus sp.]|nr:DNA polymerase III subunit gamma/tau [Ruminococcus sp.]
DDIRELREGVIYTPELCKYKVYIIDEVHMLSQSAFNALLKIMEEPPPYVKFILATTEIHKVPATITSRCQRYDFRRIRSADIAARLKFIASQENIPLTDDGADMIAGLADGGMRDAVSLLDRCSVYTGDIDAAAVSNAAGIAGREYLYDMLGAISDNDTPRALAITGSLYDMSKDLARLCEELIAQLRNVMLMLASPDTAAELIVCMPNELEKLRELAAKTDLPTVMDRLNALQQCRERMPKVMNQRVEFEMTLIKLCSGVKNTAEGIDNSEIYDKIKQLENKINSAPRMAKASPGRPAEPEVLTANGPSGEAEPVPDIDLKKLRMEDLKPLERWNDVLEEFRKVNPSVAGSLDGSYAQTAGNVIFITSQNRFFITLFKVRENAVSLGSTISKVLGKRYVIRARCATTAEEQKSMAEQLIKKAIDSSIETAVDNNQ